MPGPDKIMIIRHAEKPETAPAAGVGANGAASKDSLIVRGWQRAGALVPFFTRPSAPVIGVPKYVYVPLSSKRAAMMMPATAYDRWRR